MIRKCVLLLICVFLVVEAQMDPTENYTHYAKLGFTDQHRMHVYWKFTDKNITFEVHSRTTGWLGIGFSDGGMNNADIVIGWVANGTAHALDLYSLQAGAPTVDPRQNIELIEGAECDGWTMIKFSRELAACEEKDREITQSTMRLIWASGQTDPSGEVLGEQEYHQQFRGSVSVYLLESADKPMGLPDGPTYKTFDIIANDFLIPTKRTYYNCRLYKIPDLEKKHHIVKFEPIIQEGHERMVHHILIYRCGDNPKNMSEVNVNARCYSENMGHFQSCTTVIVSWAIGGGNTVYPEEAGLSIGAEGDPVYIQMEIHYDNPFVESVFMLRNEMDEDALDQEESVSGGKLRILQPRDPCHPYVQQNTIVKRMNRKRDNSGIRFTYTDTLRKNDVGVLYVGNAVIATQHFIPPKAKSFLNVGLCYPECLEKGMGMDSHNLTVFSVLLHSHLAGRAMRLRHFREGDELPYIANDETYDFNYQEAKFVYPPITVTPKDTLRMECVYDTSEREEMTEGGFGTRKEMCISFVMYYPKIGTAVCASSISATRTWPYFGIDLKELRFNPEDTGLNSMYLAGPEEMEGKTVKEVMNVWNWNETTADAFSDALVQMQQQSICVPLNRTEATLLEYPPPVIKSEYAPSKKVCDSQKSSNASTQFQMQDALTCDTDGSGISTSAPPLETTSSCPGLGLASLLQGLSVAAVVLVLYLL